MTERTEQLISMFLQASFAMTEEQRDELSSWITQGTANTREFIQASLFHRCIHDILLDSDIERNRILQDDTDMNRGSFDSRLWQMLLKEEETAPGIEIERPVPEEEPIRYVKPEKRQYKFNKTSF